MTAPGYQADHEQLRGHAASLAGYADRLSAIGTRLPNEMGEGSLGSFAQFITAGLGNAMSATMDGFASVASTVDKVSVGMRDVADRYQRDDDGTTAAMSGIDAKLEDGR